MDTVFLGDLSHLQDKATVFMICPFSPSLTKDNFFFRLKGAARIYGKNAQLSSDQPKFDVLARKYFELFEVCASLKDHKKKGCCS